MSSMKRFLVTLTSRQSDQFVTDTFTSLEVQTTVSIRMLAETDREAATRARDFVKDGFEVNGVEYLNSNLGIQGVVDLEKQERHQRLMSLPSELAGLMYQNLDNPDQLPVKTGNSSQGPVFAVSIETHALIVTFTEENIHVVLWRHVEGDGEQDEQLVDRRYDYPWSLGFVADIQRHLEMFMELIRDGS